MKTFSARIAHRLRIAKTHNAPSTRDMLACKFAIMADYFGESLTQDKVDGYVAHRLAIGKKPSTVNYELDLLRSVCHPSDGLVFHRLKDRAERGRVYLTQIEIGNLLSAMDEPMRRVALAYLYTGCRLSELLSIKEEDLTVNPGFLRVRNQKTMTNTYDQYRMVPVRWELVGLLPLAATTRNIFRSALTRAASRAGVGIRVTPKTLRATFASTLVQNGVSLETVAQLLGHSDVKITRKHYAHLAPRNLVSAVEHLPSWVAPTGDEHHTVALP